MSKSPYAPDDFDGKRFREIVREHAREDLFDKINNDEYTIGAGEDAVRVRIPEVDLPRFIYGDGEMGGIGQGKGEKGQATQGEPGEEGDGSGVGTETGQHTTEEFSIEELGELLQEKLDLPNIEDKGERVIRTVRDRYRGLRRKGPYSLFRIVPSFYAALEDYLVVKGYPHGPERVLEMAGAVLARNDGFDSDHAELSKFLQHHVLKGEEPLRDDAILHYAQQIVRGELALPKEDMEVVIDKPHHRFLSWTEKPVPQSDAVVLYGRDFSGSVSREQTRMAKRVTFWIDTWLKFQYGQLESRYFVHDTNAKEVTRNEFFTLENGGGTLIYSLYDLVSKVIQTDYSGKGRNIYLVQFSDGDIFEDHGKLEKILATEIVPRVNLMAYGQVSGAYGSGEYKDVLDRIITKHDWEEKVVTHQIDDNDDILPCIRTFFGVGR